MDLGGRTVLVTGASSGIGREAALAFASRGAAVALVARRKERLESLKKEIEGRGGVALAVPCDVSDQRMVSEAAGTVRDSMGCPDILVNNAGFAVFDTILNMDVTDMQSQMATNYFGMIYITKEFLPEMVERGSGHIVNVASVAASFGLPGAAPYCATKSAMLGFSEGLRHELSGTGVGVTVVSPIMVRTELFDGAPDVGQRGLRFSISPEAVAGAILRASGSPRAEITVPAVARVAVWAKHGIPFLTDYTISRLFRNQMSADEPDTS